MVDLQVEIEKFVQTWGPDPDKHAAVRDAFIRKLRALLNSYAQAAIKHGNVPEVGKPHVERGQELKTREEFEQLSRCCDFLEHYHLEHTDDIVTRFRGKGGDRPDIYIVSDPHWKKAIADCVAPIMQ